MRTALFFLSALAVVGTTVCTSPAHACSPPQGPPPAGTIQSLTPALDRNAGTGAPLPIPKDGAIVFQITAGAMSDDDLRTKAGIVVTNVAGETVKGELRRSTETRSDGDSTWVWRPEATLAPGALNVTTIAEVGTTAWTVAVEDRVLAVRKLPITLTVTRQLIGDSAAPTIACASEVGNSCGSSGRQSVASRMKAVPSLNYATEDLSLDREQPFFRATVRLFGRTNGTIHEESVRPDHLSPGGGTYLQATYDEYCVSITNASVMNDALTETSESCVPNAIDPQIPVAEEDAAVKAALKTCESPAFPEGSTAEDPTGRGGTSAGGCAMFGAPGRAGGVGGIGALLLAAGGGLAGRLRRRARR